MLAEVLAFLQREIGEPLCGSHRRSARRRELPSNLSLQCRKYVHKSLSVKYFHGVLAGNVRECLLKSSIGKASILDWVQAQMALLEIGMAKMEEVFLPYMLDQQGHTLFERMEQRGFLLDSGKRQEEAA